MILEGALGRQFLGKPREPLKVQTMQQTARRASLAKGRREAASRVARGKPAVIEKPEPERSGMESMVKAAEAGYAKHAGVRHEKGKLMVTGVSGTPLHMSPEQVRGEKETMNPAVSPVPSKKNPRSAAGSARWMRQAGIPAGVHTTSSGAEVARATSAAWGKPIKPAIQKPRIPAPTRTQSAMRQAGVQRALRK